MTKDIFTEYLKAWDRRLLRENKKILLIVRGGGASAAGGQAEPARGDDEVAAIELHGG